MSENIFEQARNLAEGLLNTNEGKRYQETKFIFEADQEATEKLSEYEKMRRQFQARMHRNESGEEFEKARTELNEMIESIKKDEVISNFFRAEEDFNGLVNNVMDIFNATLTGEESKPKGGGCGSGGCSGCSCG